MVELSLAELAARVAVIEARLGITPAPVPVPDPPPVPLTPAAPTGLRATTLPDGRPQLDWDPAAGVTSWRVFDTLDTVTPLKDTVTTPRSIRSAIKAGSRRAYAVQAVNAAGVSPLSAVLYLPTPPAPAPAPDPVPTPAPGAVTYPADLISKNWYLTLPVPRASDGLATEIHQPGLSSYTSRYFELAPARDAIVFRCWHGGATTSGSKNPRSELREETNNGAAHAAWSTTAGRHRMVVDGQVNRLTKVRPHLVIGQIHDAADDVTVFRVEGDKLWITAGDDPHGFLLDGNFQVGQRYQIGFDVSGGVVSYLYNGQAVLYTLRAATTGCYFKAGAYLQSNPTSAPGESTSEYAEAVIYSAVVTHSP